MKTQNFYEQQLVGVADLLGLQSIAEFLFQNLGLEVIGKGVATGFGVTQSSPAALTVLVAAGSVYLPTGDRSHMDAAATVNCNVDHLAAATAVAAPGNEKWLSVFAVYNQVDSSPVVTPLSGTINYISDDGVTLLVYQGAEAAVGAATRPALLSNAVLLADVHLIYGQTSIANADIDTTRRELVKSTSWMVSYIDNKTWPESSITGLVSDLAGKSDVGHTHPISDITGLAAQLAALTTSDAGKVPISGNTTVHDVKTFDGSLRASNAPTNTLDVMRLADMGVYALKSDLFITQAVWFTAAFGPSAGYSRIDFTSFTQIGSSNFTVDALNNEIDITAPGAYEVEIVYKVNSSTPGTGQVIGAGKIWLKYGATAITPDFSSDTGADEVTQVDTCIFLVDAAWLSLSGGVKVYFEHAGNFNGKCSAKIKYLGLNTVNNGMSIVTGNQTFVASSTQTYPDVAYINLSASGAKGVVTWSVQPSLGGSMDGTTDPKAEIDPGNNQRLKITWGVGGSPTLPLSKTVILRAVDSSSPAQTVDKTITITLNPAAGLSVTTVSPQTIERLDGSTSAVQLTMSATGGAPGYTWAITAQTPPAGLANATITSAGILTIPTPSGGWDSGVGTYTYSVTVRATDTAAATATKVLSITVDVTAPDTYCCVPEGTLIMLPDGSEVPIETLQVGQEVWGYDDKTWERCTPKITEIIDAGIKPMWLVTSELGSLEAAWDHRIWTETEYENEDLYGPHFPRIGIIEFGDVSKWMNEDKVLEEITIGTRDLHYMKRCFHINLDHGHIYVAGRVPSHNIKLSCT